MFDIGLEISPDSMLVAYVNDQKSAKQKENKSISVAVLSERLNLLWEKQIELDVPASRFEYVQSLVGNDGVVYVLARNFIPANEREVLFKPFEYVVYKLHHTGVEKRALETDLENILVDMKMSLNEETGELSLAGFYQNKFVGPGIQGIFYFSGNMEKGFDSNSFFTFDDELLAWFNSSKALEKNSGISESFFIKDQIRHPNGDWSLIAEDSFIIAEEGDDDEFHSYDVLVIRFSPSGELKHVAHVPKFFNDDVQYATSYSFATNQNNIYLLFNYTKQKEEFAEGEEKCFICTYTDLVIINQDGKVESASQLVKSKPRDGKIFPFASATKNGAFLIVSKYLRNSTLGLITVE